MSDEGQSCALCDWQMKFTCRWRAPLHHLAHGARRLIRGEVLMTHDLLEQWRKHHKSMKFFRIRRPSSVIPASG